MLEKPIKKPPNCLLYDNFNILIYKFCVCWDTLVSLNVL